MRNRPFGEFGERGERLLVLEVGKEGRGESLFGKLVESVNCALAPRLVTNTGE
jgi:hypothetical protein